MPRSRSWWAGLAPFMSLAWATQAAAAEISIEPNGTPSSALIGIDGTLFPEDIDQFRTKVAGIKNATVLFRGDGGSVLAAIRLGRYIRLKNWSTHVPADTTCASACALAWLGGTRRLASPTARIGFHAAHAIKGDQVTETGLGNAIVGRAKIDALAHHPRRCNLWHRAGNAADPQRAATAAPGNKSAQTRRKL
jgi:hypothetical protein